MSLHLPTHRITKAEFWKIETESERKLEFIDGEFVEWEVMAGSSSAQARIAANIIGTFSSQLRGRPCYVTTSDQLLLLLLALSI